MANRFERPTIAERRLQLRWRRRGGPGQVAAALLGWAAAGLLFFVMALLIRPVTEGGAILAM
jgi:hypothetical protein